MKFDVLTIFPELIDVVMQHSIIGRAQKEGIIEVHATDIRAFSKNKHKKVDDYPYGGGNGMVMSAEPIYEAYSHIKNGLDYKPHVVYMSPQGKPLTQDLAKSFLQYNHIIILCGHYEGVDERVIEEIVDQEVSIGDYVLTGGELPAMVFIDCISRMVTGVLSSEECFQDESHFSGLLEYPQYTRPDEFMGNKVPDVLLSGHHKNIENWRREQAISRTRKKRPDMI